MLVKSELWKSWKKFMEIKKQAIYSDLYLYKTPHILANLHGLNLQYSILLEVNFPEF